ncbi:hypothetical protein [Roseateles sp. BYS78W]
MATDGNSVEVRNGRISVDERALPNSQSSSSIVAQKDVFSGPNSGEQRPSQQQPKGAAEHPSAPLIETALNSESQVGIKVRRFRDASSAQLSGMTYGGSVVAFELRGPYIGLKRWTAMMLSSWPRRLVLKSLDLTHTEGDDNSGKDVEARVEFLFIPAGSSP